MTSPDPTSRLCDTIRWAASHNYAGNDYADGLSSKLLTALPIEHPYINLGVQELAKRAPLNLRPVLCIPARRNFKGSGLFISAQLTAYSETNNPWYLRQAIQLAVWLLSKMRDDPFGWGHNHRLQTLHGTIPRNTPSIVTITYVLRGLLRLRTYGIQYPIDFPSKIDTLIHEFLDFEYCENGARIAYRAGEKSTPTILNANALCASLLVELAFAYDDHSLIDIAEQLFSYVAAAQSDIGGWTYTDPPNASHLSMDSHHNGFILESFLRRESLLNDNRYGEVIDDALAFHREILFEADGAPNWDEHSTYPRDIHAAAQGIITFARAGDTGFALQIADWTDRNLHCGHGQYRYRQGRFFTRNITLMRWGQAWMARAYATLIECEGSNKQDIPIASSAMVR